MKYEQTRKKKMKSGDALAGMKKMGIQLRRQNMMAVCRWAGCGATEQTATGLAQRRVAGLSAAWSGEAVLVQPNSRLDAGTPSRQNRSLAAPPTSLLRDCGSVPWAQGPSGGGATTESTRARLVAADREYQRVGSPAKKKKKKKAKMDIAGCLLMRASKS